MDLVGEKFKGMALHQSYLQLSVQLHLLSALISHIPVSSSVQVLGFKNLFVSLRHSLWDFRNICVCT